MAASLLSPLILSLKMAASLFSPLLLLLKMGANLSLPLILVLLWSSSSSYSAPSPKLSYPALFIFGDSLVDIGNNNYIMTIAKANSLPFGIDFPQGPTGRYTNGKTVLDILAEEIDLPYPPPYLAPTSKGRAILKGVNYASAAGGILERSGFNFLGRVPMGTQLEWFSNTIQEMQQLLGTEFTMQRVAESAYGIVVGNNDYINNYYLKISGTAQQYTLAQYQQILITKFRLQLTKLYELGARTIIIGNLGPLGCIPSQKANRGSLNGECLDDINNAAFLFNKDLDVLIDQLNSELPNSNFIVIQNFQYVLDFHNNPTKYGFKVGDTACCGTGRYKGISPCLPILRACKNRDDYVFFDAYHPSQKANIILAQLAFDGLVKRLKP